MKKFHTVDKQYNNHSNYVCEGFGLTFKDFEDKGEASYMTEWELASQSEVYVGKDIPDLLATLKTLIDKYELTIHSEYYKDILIIYTDRYAELGYYMLNYITGMFPTYFQVFEVIEFRGCWNEDLDDAQKISDWANMYIEKLFTEDGYFYQTPSQISRKRIYKMCKKNDELLGNDIFPRTPEYYFYIRDSLYGGLCYCPFPKADPFTGRIIEIDIKSAYIYCFLKRHCVSAGRRVNKDEWEKYLGYETKGSIGKYRITYSSWSRKITCYKTIDGLIPNEDKEAIATDVFRFNNIDLKIFLDTVNVLKVECLSLYEFDMDYLPQSVIKTVVDMFLSKEHGEGAEKAIAKVALNSIYGNTSRNIKSKNKKDKEKAKKEEEERFYKFNDVDKCLPPQWGVFITSYCKELVIGLGSQLDGWLYSDTDSIFCFDTPENEEKIRLFNEKTRRVVKDFCDTFGYPFENLKNLGAFMVEEEIVKFKAWKQKQYAFTRKVPKIDPKTGEPIWIVVKASGCKKRPYPYDDSVYGLKKVPTGEKVLKIRPVTEPHTITIDGVTYTSETSYWKSIAEGEAAEMLAEMEYYARGKTLPY